jgi:SAM-dependent methyltransferase
MGLHREWRRFKRIGLRAYAIHFKWRSGNRLIRLLNRFARERKECPCCGWRGARFLHYFGKGYYVAHVVCPRCGSHDRHRGLVFLLRKMLAETSAGTRVLHLAPEKALAPLFTSRRDLSYVTADLHGHHWLYPVDVLADVTLMPFRDGVFGLVVTSGMLEHLENDSLALEEISRVTAEGGRVAIYVPHFADWRDRPTLEFGAPDPKWDDHWRIYGSDLVTQIETVGLKCSAVSFGDLLSPSQLDFYQVRALDTIFIGEKLAPASEAASLGRLSAS